MRESEITKELENLSKRAKELGFPQVVEEGDWLFVPGDGLNLFSKPLWRMVRGEPRKDMLHIPKDWFLILDMSEIEAKAVCRILEEEKD